MEGFIIMLAFIGAVSFFWFPDIYGTRSQAQRNRIFFWRMFLCLLVIGSLSKVTSAIVYILKGS